MPDDDTADEPLPDLSGQTVGDYRVQRKLGEGGMGQVYLARQLSLKRDVALKVLRPEMAANATALKRFQAEAEAVARVTHPNIVQVYAVGEHQGLRFMVLEYVEGRNLREYLARKGPPELPLALALLRQVAAALQRASEAGLVHRDIKPENILLTRKGEAKVADFGLSRDFGDAEGGDKLHLTRSGMTVGTPLYMSPEQVQGRGVDHRSDLYSFGVTAYHLLAGRPPFTGATAFEVALKHVQDEPPPLAAARPDLPAALAELVHRLMAKRPEERPASAKDVLRDLARVQKGEASAPSLTAFPVAVAPPVVYAPAARPPQRWPRVAIALGSIALAGGAGWGVAGWLRPHPTEEVAATLPGLPPARLPEPLVSGRERELRVKLRDRAATAAEAATAGVELGLLLVRERRLDDAEKAFAELTEGRFANGQLAPLATLGLAIVRAHQDRAEESVKLFESAQGRAPKPTGPAQKRRDEWFFQHPDLAPAVAEALTRDAENLPTGQKLPASLRKLQVPGAGRE